MREKIVELLKNVEKEQNVTVLFAVENGSRAWGMSSKDSDYDVRFVFCRPLAEYIKLDKPEEVITLAYDENFQPHEVKGSLLDMCGFDIFKYLKLLSTSNPTAIEWLNSPIVYLGSTDIELKAYVNKNFSQEKLFYHYFSLFKNNYNLNIKEGKEITYKKYLYSMRGLLNAKYVCEFDKIPPLKMVETVADLSVLLPQDVITKLNEVIAIKSAGAEKEKVLHIPLFDEFFKQELAKPHPQFNKRKSDMAPFDAYLQSCLGVNGYEKC